MSDETVNVFSKELLFLANHKAVKFAVRSAHLCPQKSVIEIAEEYFEALTKDEDCCETIFEQEVLLHCRIKLLKLAVESAPLSPQKSVIQIFDEYVALASTHSMA